MIVWLTHTDLKAFERRMTEVVTSMKPKAVFWRWIFFILSLFVVYGAFQWVFDPITFQVPFTTSLYNHMFFTVTFVSFVFLMLYGILHKMFASRKIVERVRYVLSDFNMSCDDNGRLILNPRPLNSITKESSPGSPSKTKSTTRLLEDSTTPTSRLGQQTSSAPTFRSTTDIFPTNKWNYS